MIDYDPLLDGAPHAPGPSAGNAGPDVAEPVPGPAASGGGDTAVPVLSLSGNEPPVAPPAWTIPGFPDLSGTFLSLQGGPTLATEILPVYPAPVLPPAIVVFSPLDSGADADSAPAIAGLSQDGRLIHPLACLGFGPFIGS